MADWCSRALTVRAVRQGRRNVKLKSGPRLARSVILEFQIWISPSSFAGIELVLDAIFRAFREESHNWRYNEVYAKTHMDSSLAARLLLVSVAAITLPHRRRTN